MPTAVALALLLLGANLDVEGGAIIEARRGSAPINSVDPPHSASVGVVTPEAGVLVAGRDDHFRLRYFPALTSISLDGQSGTRLYVLHQVDFEATLRTNRRLTWTLRAAGATGDTDYTALAQLLGRIQGQLPSVTGFTTGTAVLTAGLALNRRSEGAIALEVLHRAPLGQSPDDTRLYPNCAPPAPLPDPRSSPPPPLDTVPAVRPPLPAGTQVHPPLSPLTALRTFPTEDTVTLTPELIHTLTRRDALDIQTGLGSLWLSNGLRMLSVSPHLGWRHSFGRNTNLRAGAGMVYTNLAERPPPGCVVPEANLPDSTFSPLADVALGTMTTLRGGLVLTADLNAAATWYFDPVISRAGAIGTTGVRLAAIFVPDWSVRLEAFFSTSLRAQPLAGDPDETVFTSALPIRYQMSREFHIELGGRWSDRGPHLRAENFQFRRRELWIYASVGGTFGTARPTSRAGVPGRVPVREASGTTNSVQMGPSAGGPDFFRGGAVYDSADASRAALPEIPQQPPKETPTEP